MYRRNATSRYELKKWSLNRIVLVMNEMNATTTTKQKTIGKKIESFEFGCRSLNSIFSL